MRRRIRSAAFPIHRHAVPQVVLDAGLVALAYWLAYRLRFDGGIPEDYHQLFTRTLAFVVIGSVVIFAAFGIQPTSLSPSTKTWLRAAPVSKKKNRLWGEGAGSSSLRNTPRRRIE